jgi:GNAT superfamily N-acetyltransferase
VASRVAIRRAKRGDLDRIVELDGAVTGVVKRDYWRDVFRRCHGDGDGDGRRHFLVADLDGDVAGFILGEVRDWEFGSAPCGWVYELDVQPEYRQSGIGAQLLEALRADLRNSGVRKLRTMLDRDNVLVLSFFRSQGMMAGPFIPLEMDLE